MPAQKVVLGQKIIPPIVEVAKAMRANPTPAEQVLWDCLRSHRLNGRKFSRQQVIGEFIVDFYCHQAGLVIELDGGIHQDPDQQAYDQQRDQVLVARGLHLLRIPNERVGEDLERVLAEIEHACEQLSSQPGEERTVNLWDDSTAT